MKLVAEIITGTLFFVEIDEDATVRDLKKKIGNQENLPIERLILLLDADDQQRRLMDKDDSSLKSYGAQDWSHIYIFFGPLDHDVTPYSPSTPQYPVSNAPSPSCNVSYGHHHPNEIVDPSE
ncbi:hypothetical protein PHJA_001413400 [Phtheirospermum japonicum]|uniref:Ubiquitin-like domain-containing protein n=1 Tax=Phtheirospermum japonicum TaxID=374723 RepID=A0A830C3H7_9LAMI|nr:hypothetical protein PHJA_001413400 [Phtheirospermum japonicum]